MTLKVQITCWKLETPILERSMTIHQGLGKMLACKLYVRKVSTVQTMLKIFTKRLNTLLLHV